MIVFVTLRCQQIVLGKMLPRSIDVTPLPRDCSDLAAHEPSHCANIAMAPKNTPVRKKSFVTLRMSGGVSDCALLGC